MNSTLFYYNSKTWTISNRLGFIVYRAYSKRDFRQAVRRYRAIRLEY